MSLPESSTNEDSSRGHAARSTFRPLTPDLPHAWPCLIYFHGASDSCATSWASLTKLLREREHRILLFDRGVHQGTDVKPQQAVSDLASYLAQNVASTGGPPYVLIAHSYGGCIARLYLQQYPQDVAGMVLVETGQETALSGNIEEQQYRRQILGSRPLSVIRGNTLLAKVKAQKEAANTATTHAQHEQVQQQARVLKQWLDHDEMLKKAQLRLSRNHRYVNLPDCGHHVIRDRPEAVAEQVDWVMEEIAKPESSVQRGRLRLTKGRWRRWVALFAV